MSDPIILSEINLWPSLPRRLSLTYYNDKSNKERLCYVEHGLYRKWVCGSADCVLQATVT